MAETEETKPIATQVDDIKKWAILYVSLSGTEERRFKMFAKKYLKESVFQINIKSFFYLFGSIK